MKKLNSLISKHMIKRFFSSLLGLLTAFAGWSQNPQLPDDPRQLTIYQVMVASFIHGEGGAEGYTRMWGPDGHTKNGNLRGIIQSLDHIQALGCNAIWMTPIFDSSLTKSEEKLKATGYFTNNYFAIDPHFGTEAELREFIDEAHRRGIAVIFDGVFGHHGGITSPSPAGLLPDGKGAKCDRPNGAGANVAFPASLPYMTEVATYWIDQFGIDGWRLDVAPQLLQGGHNYWVEVRRSVERLCAERRQRGETVGILGYMVGEDWGDANVVNNGVYTQGGLVSAFDFEGKERISGPMQSIDGEGLTDLFGDIVTTLSVPTARGYLSDEVMPNLFLSNHDGYRLADHFSDSDPYRYDKMMLRHAILAMYTGPITLYYGDEFGDLSRNTVGGQKDNIARTSGHIHARDVQEQRLCDYVSHVMNLRANHTAMWRGITSSQVITTDRGQVLVVTKTDPFSSDVVDMIVSDHYDNVLLPNSDQPVFVTPYRALIIPRN